MILVVGIIKLVEETTWLFPVMVSQKEWEVEDLC
jgi:hypothetical protein